MIRHVEFETTIKGGLPVLIKANIHAAEPDIGIFGEQVEWDAFWTSGKPLTIAIPREDMERIEEECLSEVF